MSTIIRDLQYPVIKESTKGVDPKVYGSFRILSGYVNDKPFEFWYVSLTQAGAMKQADIAWEAHKKTLYGPSTHVETVRPEHTIVCHDKYRSPE